jgi:hypothetical protein
MTRVASGSRLPATASNNEPFFGSPLVFEPESDDPAPFYVRSVALHARALDAAAVRAEHRALRRLLIEVRRLESSS